MATDDNKPGAITLVDIDKRTTSDGERSQCISNRKDGKPCGAFSAKGSRFCLSHDPERAADREAWRKAGGFASSSVSRAVKRIPDDLRPVRTLVLECIREVYDGSLSPRQAVAIASLAKVAIALEDSTSLADRVRKLEEERAA